MQILINLLERALNILKDNVVKTLDDYIKE
jgi:hypothetical protein